MAKKLDELILKLKEDKISQDEIEKTVQFISQIVAGKYYTELMLNFTPEEITEINQAKDQEEANTVIKIRFMEKTGKTADQLREKMFDYYADEVLTDYLKTKKLPEKKELDKKI